MTRRLKTCGDLLGRSKSFNWQGRFSSGELAGDLGELVIQVASLSVHRGSEDVKGKFLPIGGEKLSG